MRGVGEEISCLVSFRYRNRILVGCVKLAMLVVLYQEYYGATQPFRRLSHEHFTYDMAQLLNGERRLLQSLAASPESDQDRRSPEDYVGIIQDTLKLHRPVELCRHFQMLDRTEVFSSEIKIRVRVGRRDVWPVRYDG